MANPLKHFLGIIEGIYNSTQPTVGNGDPCPIQVDSRGNLLVSVGAGGMGNASVGNTGATAPGAATEIGIIDNSGDMTGVSATTPIRVDPVGTTVQPVSGTVTAKIEDSSGNSLNSTAGSLNVNITGGSGGNSAASATGSDVPADADYIAFNNVSGKLTGVSASTPLPVVVENGSIAVTGTFWQATQPISGTVTANAGTGNFTVVQGTGTNLHVVVDTAPTTAVTGTFYQATQPVSGTFWQATQPVSGTVTANAGTGNFTVVQGTGTNLHTVVDSGTVTAVTAITNALPAGTNVIGHVIADTGSTTAVTQTTASSLNATVTPAAAASFAVQDSEVALQSVTFTSSTPADTSNTVALSNPNTANVAVSLHYSGSVTGGQVFFEVSNDNSNWYGITMAPTSQGSNPVDTYTLSSAAGNIAWQMFVGAFTYFRCRVHVQVVGSGSAIIGIIPSVIAAEPAVALAGGTAAVTNAGTFAVQTTAASYVPAAIQSVGQVAVAGTATQIIASNASRQGVVINNTSTTVNVYLGGSGVTATTGFQLSPGAAITIPSTASVYGIVTLTSPPVSQTVTFLELQ